MKNKYLDCLALFGVGGAHPGGLQLTKRILSREKIDKTKTILDAGCGTGQTSAYIAEKYQCHVTSLDTNKLMLDKARKRFLSLQLPIEVKHGSTENLPFDGELFDFILSESVISFTDVPLSLQEFNRVLKPEGVLFAIEMVQEKPIAKKELSSLLTFYGIPRLLTESEWCNLLKKSGFKHVKVEKDLQQIDEIDLELGADFTLSEDIDGNYFEILEKHQHLTEVYKDVLGFRVFRCCK
ncbi:class I SAM-dependent methyltransferase [Oceanobacillus sp. Castelsardo]|uniref:class I SAM-dependent methyltransferase n=1 Tax=Oceanobacillus sp. Castelsardo TaxID=1851204 RepID=UPI0008387DCE|nr:class I SAM-dependent methyltransferase [Oceanobacillus sp. Castelsardo]